MRRESHHPPVPPCCRVGQLLPWCGCAQFSIEHRADGVRPRRCGGLTFTHPADRRAIALKVVGNTPRSIEVNGFDGAHEAPAQRQPILDGLVQVLGRNVALSDQSEGLVQHGKLQAVQDEALDLAFYGNRLHAAAGHEISGAVDDLRRCEVTATQFNDRGKVWRVQGMRDEATLWRGKAPEDD